MEIKDKALIESIEKAYIVFCLCKSEEEIEGVSEILLSQIEHFREKSLKNIKRIKIGGSK